MVYIDCGAIAKLKDRGVSPRQVVEAWCALVAPVFRAALWEAIEKRNLIQNAGSG
jgi:acyl-CoA hydrolase